MYVCARARARVCVCACVCLCVCGRGGGMRACADPIIMVFVRGVEYGYLCVYNVMRESHEGMYLNIVLIVTCFIASVTLSLLMNEFICTSLL